MVLLRQTRGFGRALHLWIDRNAILSKGMYKRPLRPLTAAVGTQDELIEPVLDSNCARSQAKRRKSR